MEFSVGDLLSIQGNTYHVMGKIRYKNLKDNCCWFEYRLLAKDSRREKWLSYDDVYNEYSLSEVTNKRSTNGYHLVDSGVEEVVGVWGSVDVEIGERATFDEYEDVTEEKILSSEVWEDGEEISVGYYLDLDEIQLNSGNTANVTNYKRSSSNQANSIAIIMLLCFVVSGILSSGILSKNTIEKYLKESSFYEQKTFITGKNKEDATVYSSSLTLDATVKDIISAIDGEVESVQQNTEDGDDSVALLTKKEYCLVYTSEDNEVLVQISSRKYAYANDSSPYRARSSTYRYYRRYYYSKGYSSDSTSYKRTTSPYSSYEDTTIIDNSSDMYSSYSDTIRQASASVRSSSGGGISRGK